MGKTYKRRYYRGGRDKYSVEQQAGLLQIPAGQQGYAVVVADTAIQGMRKVKHLTVSLAAAEPATPTAGNVGASLVYWALVYVPQGTTPNQLSLTGTTGMYEPNQFVMNCGVADFSAGPLRFHSPVSRNLNSGDRIVLIATNISSTDAHNYYYVVRYAVTLQ